MSQDQNKPYEPPNSDSAGNLNDPQAPCYGTPSYTPPSYEAPQTPSYGAPQPPSYPQQPAAGGYEAPGSYNQPPTGPTPPGSFEPGAPGAPSYGAPDASGYAAQNAYPPPPGQNPYAPAAAAAYGQNPWATPGDNPGQTATALVRFLGLIIDGILLSIVNGIIGAILPSNADGSASALALFIQFVISASYYIVLNGQGQTVGKMIMKTKVVDAENGQPIGYARAALRYVMYLVMALPLFLGYLSVPLNPEKRGWHDKVANTRVVKTA